jgi:hypothetical protein
MTDTDSKLIAATCRCAKRDILLEIVLYSNMLRHAIGPLDVAAARLRNETPAERGKPYSPARVAELLAHHAEATRDDAPAMRAMVDGFGLAWRIPCDGDLWMVCTDIPDLLHL